MKIYLQIFRNHAQHMKTTQQPLTRAVASLVSHFKRSMPQDWDEVMFVAREIIGLLQIWQRVQRLRGQSVHRDVIRACSNPCLLGIAHMREVVHARINHVCKTPSMNDWKDRFEQALSV